MQLMTQAEYARHRGVSRQAVNKAIGAGKIPLRESHGRKGIDPAEADRALGLNVQRVLATAPAEDERDAAPRQAPGLTQARTATEVYRARLAELEFKERIGKLRPVEQTELGAQRCAEVVLRAIDRIGGRAEELAAMVTKDGLVGARTCLRDIARELRAVAAREFATLAAGEHADAEGESEPA